MAETPYPGLRPFNRDEADIFFGRESHIDAMVDRLAERRLLTVTGTSGSGKSSLVRAGLLQGLEMGLLNWAGRNWRVAELRPGEHPMRALGAVLASVLSPDRARSLSAIGAGPRSILAQLREEPLPSDANLLILVDQFEELFRYESLGTRDEAEAFVSLLLGIPRHSETRTFVVLTMRSDFLGDCAKFEGLAEAINESMYLCPRLDRHQISAAIEQPARVFGGSVEPTLIGRLIDDMGTDPDQLPLMQHALLRLWEKATQRNAMDARLCLADYLDADGLKGSLSGHADEIRDEVVRPGEERQDILRRMFCLLVEGTSADRAVRRPTSVSEIIAVTGAPLPIVTEIADAFRRRGRTFLMPPVEQELREDSVLDISHESLIRQWDRIAEWLHAEAASAEQYRQVELRAQRWTEGRPPSTLWDAIDLDLALGWRDREQPNTAWARRYGGNFDLAMRFLDESREQHETAKIELDNALRERQLRAAEEAVAREQAEVVGSSIGLEDTVDAKDLIPQMARLRDHTAPEPTFYKFVLRHSWKDQLLLLIVAVFSFPILYYLLDMPKIIVNRAIGGTHFPQKMFGLSLNQIPYLMTVCGVMLILFFIYDTFQYSIAIYKGKVGERMLRRLRYMLYLQSLRFPLMSQDTRQLVPMITTECEQLGGAISDVFVQPVFYGGKLLTAIYFMFMQDIVVGLSAITLYPIQGYVISKLQRTVNQLGRRRVQAIRGVADEVYKTMSGLSEIRTNDMITWRLSTFANLLGVSYGIRNEIDKTRSFQMMLDRFLNNIPTFFLLSIGGFLVIRGVMSFGALVAVLFTISYIGLPFKELIEVIRRTRRATSVYKRIVANFDRSDMIDSALLLAEPGSGHYFSDSLRAESVSFNENGKRPFEAISFEISLSDHVAIVGQADSGKRDLARLLARIVTPTHGRVTVDGQDYAALPVATIGRRIGYAESAPYLFAGPLRENLLSGVRNYPVREPEYDWVTARIIDRQLNEARRAGNIGLDVNSDWIDYQRVGVADDYELVYRITEVLRMVGFEQDVYNHGLASHVDPRTKAKLVERILEARARVGQRVPAELREELALSEGSGYDAALSLRENILFVKIAYGQVATVRLSRIVDEVVDELDLRPAVIDVGLDFDVGAAGAHLSLAQRQRAGMARAILKRPDLLIMNEATSALEDTEQARIIQALRQEFSGRCIVWVLHRAELARYFDRVLVMSSGKLFERGENDLK